MIVLQVSLIQMCDQSSIERIRTFSNHRLRTKQRLRSNAAFGAPPFSNLFHIENFIHTSLMNKVNRCLARYSRRAITTNQISRQGLAQNEQKCHFRAKFGLFWAKNPNFYWRNQKFCHPHTENPPKHLVHVGFWSDIGQNVQKMAIFSPKWPKMQIFDQIWPFLGQIS